MRTQLTPKDIIDNSKRIVIKLGTETIIKDGKVDFEWLNAFAEDIADLKKQGKEVFVVTSGAIGLGRGLMNVDPTIPTKNLPLRIQQKLATTGQIDLILAYRQAFDLVGLRAQQVLLAADVVEKEKQILNLKNTCFTDETDSQEFLSLVPVINENDALATEEITFGDNDNLGATVTALLNADTYIILSKQEGLYTDNPAINPNARHFAYSPSEEEAYSYVNDDINGISRGGMKSKLKAAFNARAAGAYVIMAKGQGVIHCVRQLAGNDPIYCKSTTFIPDSERRVA